MKVLFKGLVAVLLFATVASADTWTNLGALSALPTPAGGAISESCQYRLKSLLSRLTSVSTRSLPGAIYMDIVSKQQTSINFGQSILTRDTDYDLVEDLKTAGAFRRSRDAAAALAILKSSTSHIFTKRLTVTNLFSSYSPSSGATLTLNLSYLSGKKTISKSFNLKADSFELEASCPVS